MNVKKIMFISAGIFAFIGIVVILCPFLLKFFYNKSVNDQLSSFHAYFDNIKADNPGYLDELYEKMNTYNKTIFEEKQNGLTDPFSYEQPSFDLLQFGFEQPIIGYIEISKIDVKLPIYLGASKENLDLGVAQLTQTSLPIGGKNTNCVIAGHRGSVRSKKFRDIVNLNTGDEIKIVNFRETLIYKVESTEIILPDSIDAVKIQENRDMITLSTCYYVNSKTANRRFIVYCARMEE